MRHLNRLEKHALAASLVALGTTAVSSAALVRWDANLVIPANIDGLYINVVSRTSGATGSGVAGWDINPYGGTTLQFFAGTGATYVRTQASGGPSSLSLGTTVGASSVFANSTTAVISSTGVGSNGWQTNSINYFGFRFLNEVTNATNYGYGAMWVGSTAAARTLLYVEYGNAGESVVIPAPGALALVGAAGLVGTRRRRS